MKNVISGVARFQREVFPEKQEKFKQLSSGQSPEVLLITCADSRIDPNLLTQTEPGELFICRNAGNVVPPHTTAGGEVSASIEFGISVLGIEHVVVCGHSDCGAMKGTLNPEGLDELPHVKQWLGHCQAAAEKVGESCGELGHDHLEAVTLENVKLQMQNLRTHPAVAARLAEGKLQLHGWYYDIETGEVRCWDETAEEFLPMGERYMAQFEAAEAVMA